MAELFESTTINTMTLANRFVRSATWMGMANEDGSVTPRLIEAMVKLAEGDVGLIITGLTCVHRSGWDVPWQLGIEIGKSQEVRVFTPSLPDTFLVFMAHAIAGPAANIAAAGDTLLTGIAGQMLEDSLRVFVSDEFGNAVSGFTAHFAVTSGNGSIGSPEIDVNTDSTGLAWCWFTLGTTI